MPPSDPTGPESSSPPEQSSTIRGRGDRFHRIDLRWRVRDRPRRRRARRRRLHRPARRGVPGGFDEDPEQTAVYTSLYRAFGIIGPDDDIETLYREFGEAGVLGFYDPATDELVVRAADELTLMAKSTIVHELTHAYDDQLFDLDRPEYDERTDEVPWTFTALIEGDASYVESRWRDTLSLTDSLALQDEEENFGDPNAFDDFELSFLFLEFSPYLYGEEFVAALVDDGGFEAVDAAFFQPS
ncbi:MAG: hypothetical protein R2695_10995 [Acidimicrobiales bacterium]